MNRTRRTSTHFACTTRRGRSFCFSRETEEDPNYRSTPTFATSAYNYAQAYAYVPPPVPVQGHYSGYSYYQPPVLAYQSASSTTYPQQYPRAYATYNSHPPTHPGEPQEQPTGTRRGPDQTSPHPPLHPTVPNPGIDTRDIQSWVNGTARSNTSYPNSRRTYSQYANSTSDLNDQHEDRNRRRNKELFRRGSVYTPSYYSTADDGSRAGGRSAGCGPQPEHIRNNPASRGPRYPASMYFVNGQVQAFHYPPY